MYTWLRAVSLQSLPASPGPKGPQAADGEQLGSGLPEEMILYPLLGIVLLIEHGC